MKTSIITSMKDTVFSPISSNMKDSLIDIAEMGIDSLLEDESLKSFPILGTIASLCRTGINLRERSLIRQTAAFIVSFNEGTIDQKKLDGYRESLDDPKKAEKELGRVILLLDRMLEEEQARILGRIYHAYVAGSIKWEKFVELSEVNTRMIVSDYAEIISIARKPITDTESIPDRRMYRIQRLESLGLVVERRAQVIDGSTIISSGTDVRYTITPLGGTLFGLMGKEAE